MRKYFKYMKDNNIFAMLYIILICLMVYFLRNNVKFDSQEITLINILAICFIMLILSNAIKKHYIRWRNLICILLSIFIFNHLYDQTVFKNVFHFELLYFLIGVFSITFLIIIFPIIKDFFKKFANFLENWALKKVKDERKNSKWKKNNINVKQQEIKQNKPIEINNIELNQSPDPENHENTKMEEEPYNRKASLNPFWSGIIFIVLFISSSLLLYVTFSSQTENIITKITSENMLNTVLTFFVILISLFFVTGIIFSIIIKWVQIISQIITNQHKGEIYFVLACCLFIFSQYVFTHYSFTTDDLADFILNGKLFTFPLILSILIPVFLIFAENIISFSKTNKTVKKALKESADQSIRIASGIVSSLLTFIEFVTSDYLTSIIELTKEDIPMKEEPKEDFQNENEAKENTLQDNKSNNNNN